MNFMNLYNKHNTLMKHYTLPMRAATLILLLLCPFVGKAQSTNNWLWPVKGQKAGQGVIYRPQDMIGEELNFGNLFITAPEGTEIICPDDAVVEDYDYDYNFSLYTSSSFGSHDKPYDKVIAEHQEEFRKKGWDIRCLSFLTGLKIGNKKLWIGGLRRDKAIPTGTRLKRGDVLGTMGYSYHVINEPCISVAVSYEGKNDDPMTPFGLRSTFRKPEPQLTKFHLTRDEAVADYKQLANSMKEIYPSLEDLMTEQEYDTFVREQLKRIPANGIALKDFARIVYDYNKVIHDSHIDIRCHVPDNPKEQKKGLDYYYSPLIFGYVLVGDSLPDYACVVLMTDSIYAKYVGRRIVRIDGKPVKELQAISRRHSNMLYDAGVTSVVDEALFYEAMFAYSGEVGPQPAGKTMVYEFEDGERLELPLVRGFRGSEVDRERWMRPYRINRHKDSPIGIRQLNDSVLYIGLSTFELSQVDCDSIVEAIHTAERNHVPNLIFDVRNNYGGHGDVMARITRALMGRTPDRPHRGYQKVNAAFFNSPTLNWIAGDTIFGDFKPIEGRKGLYQMPNEEENETPSIDSLGFNGRLYVLIDSHSASASAFLAGTIKRSYRGYIVGRETKSAYHCETCVKFANIQLANSQFTAKIPMMRIVFDETVNDRLPALRGVMPDCNIPLSEEEFHYDGDYILDRTLQLISDGTYIQAPAPDSTTGNKALPIALIALTAIILVVVFLFLHLRKKQRIITILFTLVAITVNAQEVKRVEASPEDFMEHMKLCGYEVFTYDIASLRDSVSSFDFVIREYNQQGMISEETLPNFSTKTMISDFNEEDQREIYAENDADDIKRGIYRLAKTIAIGFTPVKSDSIENITLQAIHMESSHWSLTLKPIPGAPRTYYRYRAAPFQPDSFRLNTFIPLVLYSSFWWDATSGVMRSCGEKELTEKSARTSNFFKYSPHYYIIGAIFHK